MRVFTILALVIALAGCAARAPLQMGQRPPDFTLLTADSVPVTLSEFRGRFVVLVFYRGHW